MKKDNVVGMAWGDVLTPLARAADPLSWIFFGAFVVLFLVTLVLSLLPETSGAGRVYEAFYPTFWYTSWGLLVVAVVGPIINIRRATNDLPMGVLLGTGSGLLVTFIVISVVTLFESGNPNAVTTLLSTSAAAMVVGIGWVVQAQSTARAARRTHTFNVLIQSRLSAEFQNQVKKRCEVYWAGVDVAMQDAELISPRGYAKQKDALEAAYAIARGRTKDESLPALDAQFANELALITAKHESLQGVKYLLNFYEFVCVGIRLRELDERMIHQTLGDIAIQLYDATAHVRAHCKIGQENVFVALDEIVRDRWKSDGFNL